MRENIDNHQRKKTTKMGSSRVNGNGGTVISSFPITHKRWIIPFIPLVCLCPIFILLIGIMTQPSALSVSASLTENFHDGGASYSSQLRHEKAGFGGGASSAAVAGTVGHSLMAAKSTSMHQSPRMQSEMVAADAMTMGEQVVGGLNEALDRLDTKRYTDHRMLVHEGDMKLVTLQGTLEYLTEQIRSLVSSSDGQGYVESQQSFDRSYNHGEYDTSSSTATLKGMYMTVRIASGQYFEIIQKIRAILSNDPLVKGRVVYVNTNSRDVTDEFVDAASRADVVDASRTSLLSLLKQASSLDDVFRLQREINRLTETYESHKSRANALEKQAALSKLTITIQEQSQHQTKAGRFLPIDMASLAVGQITMVCSEVGNWLIYMAILLLPFFLVACIIHKSSSSSSRSMLQACQWHRNGMFMPMTAAAHGTSHQRGDSNDSYVDSKQ